MPDKTDPRRSELQCGEFLGPYDSVLLDLFRLSILQLSYRCNDRLGAGTAV